MTGDRTMAAAGLGGVHVVRQSQRHTRISLSLTAMIDVVFLLLVYFMVATDFKAGEEIFKMDLPDRQGANHVQDPFDLDDEPLRIRLASSGSMRDACQLQVEGPYEQPRNFQQLYEFLMQRQINPQTTMGLFEADHPIIILPTRSTRWEHAIEAFNAAARAGYKNVTLAKPD